MAKVLLACSRAPLTVDPSHLARCADARLSPDNMTPSSPYVHADERTLAYVFNASPNVRTNRANVVLGTAADSSERLFEVGSPIPDGSFALFRSNDHTVEVSSDCTGSRTIWYHHSQDRFLVSTSQRLIIMLLEGFQLNERALSWMLTNGHLGPTDAWDDRLKRIPPDSTLRLDRASWDLRLDEGKKTAFEPLDLSHDEYRSRLAGAVDSAIADLALACRQWTLALSGGMDSRSLLHHLRGCEGLDAVTWGRSIGLDDPLGDATIAARLADICGIEHRYVATDARPEDFFEMLQRFLVAGECRIDHLSGYLDGLDLWSKLAQSGRDILRGYDALGKKVPVATPFQARRANGLIYTNDFLFDGPMRDFMVTEDDVPEWIRQREDETLEDWRDRLWIDFRTPVITAALDDIKAAYVEISNPLLSREVVDVVRSLPPELRTNKALFDELVQEMFPDVPFARHNAIAPLEQVLNLPGVRSQLRDQLPMLEATGLFPARLLTWLDGGLRRAGKTDLLRVKFKRFARAALPRGMVDDLRQLRRAEPLRARRVALRAVLAANMVALLKQDGTALRSEAS